jgi:putative transposase
MSRTDQGDAAGAPGIQPSRQRFTITVGSYVQKEGIVYKVVQELDFNTIIGVAVETGRSTSLAVAELQPVSENVPRSSPDLAEIADADWQEAERRMAIIRPLVDRPVFGRGDVEARAKEADVDTATVYRWIQRYRGTRSPLALISQKRGWRSGKTRIPAFAEAVIEDVIRTFYLTPQRPSAQKTVIEVMRRCQQHGIEAPSASTIRARIGRVPEPDRLRGRGYREKAKNRFMPTAGKFPNADFPLAVVQIDHTPADIILVDDLHRKPIGRPWITLAVDVHSRMIVGYYLSFDAPSETSVAMCVAQAILPKEEWLLAHHVDAEWPVWGVPKTIHVDNGSDFRSGTFRESCLAYGINLEFRPVKQPRYGGHIERLIGSVLTEIHTLPGTTFSSIKDKAGYDPEKNAALTKSEFEAWLVKLICKVYHERLHGGIGMSPKKKWEVGIFGNGEIHGVGLPPRVTDRLAVLLDFLPSFRRTIQTFGVTIDGMTYYAEALRPWINADDPDDKKRKRTFIFRRDPRDISAVWFRDPALSLYFKIPFADQSLPSMSVWEYAQVKARLRKEGMDSVNDAQVLRAITELRTQVDESKERSKKARRQAQRRVEHEKKISPAELSPRKAALPPPVPPVPGDLSADIVDGFGDIG